MTEIHYHIWLYHRDDDGVIRRMEREDAAFENRRRANYAMDKLSGNWHTAGQWRAAGQVLQCVDWAFCKPPPDWVVRVVTLAGPTESGSAEFIDQTPSIRPARKQVLGVEALKEYVEKDPDALVRRPEETEADGAE